MDFNEYIEKMEKFAVLKNKVFLVEELIPISEDSVENCELKVLPKVYTSILNLMLDFTSNNYIPEIIGRSLGSEDVVENYGLYFIEKPKTDSYTKLIERREELDSIVFKSKKDIIYNESFRSLSEKEREIVLYDLEAVYQDLFDAVMYMPNYMVKIADIF